MNIDEYSAIQKKAQREVAAYKAAKKYEYLPYLDAIIENQTVGNPENLGLISMPIDRIVGTDTLARSQSFSPSFLPLLEAGSEFQNKFVILYNSCIKEGLREPVTGFEYMGQYYIREGNKRVAVSKLQDLPAVEGVIARIMPAKSDDPEVVLNYAYRDFYQETGGINFLYFSKPSRFKKFPSMITGSEEIAFTEEHQLEVKSAYVRFSKAFSKNHGLPLSAADAFYSYIAVMGFEEIKNSTAEEMEADLRRIRKDLYTETLEDPVAVSEEPIKKDANIWQKLFKRKSNLKVAFLHKGNIENSPWVYLHELSKEYLVDTAFPGEIEADSFFDVSIEQAEDVLESLCEKKYDVIFVTSVQHMSACRKVAVDYPNVKILNCSLNSSTKLVRTYYLRTYESKYLIGLLAGAHTLTGRIAYIADYPIYGTIASINAFALGVSAANPSARVHLYWTSRKDENPYERIAELGCDLVSDLDWSSPLHQTKKFGLYALNEEKEPVNLAAPLWDWGKLYEHIIHTIQNGTWDEEDSKAGDRSLNYWWGLSSGAVDLIHSKKILPQSIRVVDFLKQAISEGAYHVFAGEISYNDGTKQTPDTHMSYKELIEMDKLLWNIHGAIPKQNELNEMTVSLTKVQGVIKEEEE